MYLGKGPFTIANDFVIFFLQYNCVFIYIITATLMCKHWPHFEGLFSIHFLQYTAEYSSIKQCINHIRQFPICIV